MRSFKSLLRAGAVFAALGSAGAAAAQQADKPIETVGEIVVTAQKRVEPLQKIPLSVSVVGHAQLEQEDITSIEDLIRAVPSLTTYGEPGNPDTRYAIRGITTQSFSITSEQAVSFVLDGVVLGRTPSANLFDISQVEVLRGPQGTLFGKNASGGVISMTTNAPDPTKYQAIGHAEFGDQYDYRVLNAVLNIPVGDKAAFRLALGDDSTNGFIHNIVRHQDSTRTLDSARLRFLWEPTSNLTLKLIADYEKQKTTEQVYIQFGEYDNAAGQPVAIPGCGPNTIITANSRVACNGDPSWFEASDYGFSAQLDWRLGGFTLTSISSYRRYLQNGFLDVDGLPTQAFDNGNLFNNKVYTQELRVASPQGRWIDYVAGAYFSDTSVYNYLTQTYGTGLFPAPLNNPNTAQSTTRDYAAFGQLTLHATKALSLTLGGRETRDEVKLDQASFFSFDGVIPNLTQLGPNVVTSDNRDNFSWKAAVQYQFDPALMAYASVTHGYKGPQIQFNPPNALAVLSGVPISALRGSASVIEPELPTAYEIGVKSQALGGRLAIDADIFYTRIKDFQTSAFNPTTGLSSAQNVPYADTKGVEIDVFGKLTRGLSLNGGLIYNIATYGPFEVTCTPGALAACPASGIVDVNGDQIAGTPKWKLTLSGEYDHDIWANLQGFVGADMVYTSLVDFAQVRDPLQEVSARAIVGTRLGVRSADRRWSANLFVRNLFDERTPVFLFAPYLLSNLTAPTITTVGRSYSTESFRLVGISLDGRF